MPTYEYQCEACEEYFTKFLSIPNMNQPTEEACPTEAILINKTIDASKCISYFTIELKSKDLPDDLSSKSENWIFGCDICQDVCPWNRFSTPHQHPELEPFGELMQFEIEDWIHLNEERFKTIFKRSPLKRSGFDGIKRNLRPYQM